MIKILNDNDNYSTYSSESKNTFTQSSLNIIEKVDEIYKNDVQNKSVNEIFKERI